MIDSETALRDAFLLEFQMAEFERGDSRKYMNWLKGKINQSLLDQHTLQQKRDLDDEICTGPYALRVRT